MQKEASRMSLSAAKPVGMQERMLLVVQRSISLQHVLPAAAKQRSPLNQKPIVPSIAAAALPGSGNKANVNAGA